MRVTARDWRALRFGFAAIGTLVVLAKGLPALRRAEAASRERESLLLSQASAIGREAVATLEAAQMVSALSEEARGELAAAAFEASTSTELLAAAARYVAGVAAAVGVTVHSVDPSVDSTWAGAGTRVEIELNVSSAGAELLRLVDELAAGPRLSVVERMEIRVRTTDVGPTERESLTAALRVVVFGAIHDAEMRS
ncbi:MAG: hypothetical protein KF709_11310 [Gemmatimonadaceae bacterium]|nr:hypothetical protein [Gemmatimonadaceae bacterium]